jgi:hypothetical protein
VPVQACNGTALPLRKAIRYMYLTAIGLTPGGSKKVHIYTQTRQDTENGTYITIKKLKPIWEVRAVPRLCELYPGIYHTNKE